MLKIVTGLWPVNKAKFIIDDCLPHRLLFSSVKVTNCSSFFKATKNITDEKLIPINDSNRRIMRPNYQFHVKYSKTAAVPTPSSETNIKGAGGPDMIDHQNRFYGVF